MRDDRAVRVDERRVLSRHLHSFGDVADLQRLIDVVGAPQLNLEVGDLQPRKAAQLERDTVNTGVNADAVDTDPIAYGVRNSGGFRIDQRNPNAGQYIACLVNDSTGDITALFLGVNHRAWPEKRKK